MPRVVKDSSFVKDAPNALRPSPDPGEAQWHYLSRRMRALFFVDGHLLLVGSICASPDSGRARAFAVPLRLLLLAMSFLFCLRFLIVFGQVPPRPATSEELGR